MTSPEQADSYNLLKNPGNLKGKPRRAGVKPRKSENALTFRILKAFARALLTEFLTLFFARVTCQ